MTDPLLRDLEKQFVVADYAQGLACYHARDWAGARAGFERSAALESKQPDRDAGVTSNPSLMYLALVAEYSVQAPPTDWDGV